MYVLENPVMQRELLVNLRMGRAFVLLLLYQALLGAVVYFAWPQDTRLDLTAGSRSVITPVGLGTSAAVKVLGEGLVESLTEANRNRPGHDGKERLLIEGQVLGSPAHMAPERYSAVMVLSVDVVGDSATHRHKLRSGGYGKKKTTGNDDFEDVSQARSAFTANPPFVKIGSQKAVEA